LNGWAKARPFLFGEASLDRRSEQSPFVVMAIHVFSHGAAVKAWMPAPARA
jgi:hypothetical protein